MIEITQCFSLWLRMIFLLSHTVIVIDSKLSLDRLTGCNEAVNLLLTPCYAKQLWTLNWNPWLKFLSEERWHSLNLNRSPDLRKRIILNLCACSVDCGPHRLRLIHGKRRNRLMRTPLTCLASVTRTVALKSNLEEIVGFKIRDTKLSKCQY